MPSTNSTDSLFSATRYVRYTYPHTHTRPHGRKISLHLLGQINKEVNAVSYDWRRHTCNNMSYARVKANVHTIEDSRYPITHHVTHGECQAIRTMQMKTENICSSPTSSSSSTSYVSIFWFPFWCSKWNRMMWRSKINVTIRASYMLHAMDGTMGRDIICACVSITNNYL